MDFQLTAQPLEILKWVGIVFAAGVIGYFGRYLGVLIIQRFHARKPDSSRPEEVKKVTTASEADKAEEKKLKLEKKRLKLEKKKEKKTEKSPD